MKDMIPMGMACNSVRTDNGMSVVVSIIQVVDGKREHVGQIQYTPEQAVQFACQVIEAAGGKR